MTGRTCLSAILILLALPTILMATTWRVEPDGSGDVPTIQAAIDTLAPGDTLILGSGVFRGTGNYNVTIPGKSFFMESETGDPAGCIIDCEGHLGSPRRAFLFQGGANPTIEGITIENGNVPATGGAIYCQGDPVLRNCVFNSNYSGGLGGAICYDYGDGFPVLEKCVFTSNQAPGGGAVYIAGITYEVTIDSCYFYGNTSAEGGAIYCEGHEAIAYIRNSVFSENSASTAGGAIKVDLMAALIRNCTFFANSAPEGSGIRCTTAGSFGYPTAGVEKCIIPFGVGGSGYYQGYVYPDTYPLQCTDMYGNEGGDWVNGVEDRLGVDGNFSKDPAFCNYEMEPYDLSLCDNSPCLPGNHPDGYACGLVGALGGGCVCDPTRAQPSTWGTIKSMYR